MTAFDLDLLRERRVQLGEPEPDRADPLRPLLQGGLLGGALVGLVLLAAAVVMLLNRSTGAEVERLSGVQARFDALQGQIKTQTAARQGIEKEATERVRALVAVRSGSGVMEDLRRRTPAGVQLSEARVEGDLLKLKGLAVDPGAFARINALELDLKRSPLFDPASVTLIKASRDEATAAAKPGEPRPGGPVQFELSVKFRPTRPAEDLATLRLLGSEGMALRLQRLQREGLIR